MSGLIRLAGSLGLLALVAVQVGDEALQQLRGARADWLLLAAALALLQVILSAWRWRYTAGRLAIPLAPGLAIREYYLATLINQTLPGGVLGDAQRAWRHGRGLPRKGPAFQAVVIERFSGQIAMAALALGAWLATPGLAAHTRLAVLAAAGGIMAVAALALMAWLGRYRASNPRRGWLYEWAMALRRGLLARDVLPLQLGASLLVATGHIMVFICCLQALGASGDALLWSALIPPVLFAMLIPFSVAGWGLREGAAALLWPLAGLPAAEGVAAAVLYGLMGLLSGLPGLLTLLRR